MQEQRDNGSGWALQADMPKLEKDVQEIHALMDRAIAAGREASEARRAAKDAMAHAEKAEAEAMNSWNEFMSKLVSYGERLDGFTGSDWYAKLYPER